jgi:hypothetical protein
MATKSKTTKKPAVKKQQASPADLTRRPGPIMAVTKMARDHDTKNSYTLTLKCGHKRTGTKRRTLRCRRCAK